ncbi:hypothetical protein Tco_0648499 [Tanacetum coccineum]
MAQLHNQQLEYIIDDEYYNMNEFADHSSATFAADPMDSDFEDDIDQDYYAVFRERLVPALTKDHEGQKTNMPYLGKAIRRIQAIWE